MYIGELSKLASATPIAIRLYEPLGLLGRVARIGASMNDAKAEPNWAAMAEQVDQRRAEIAVEIKRLHVLDLQLQEISIEIRACAELA